MRKLLNTLYVTTEESYLSLDGENIVVWKDGKRLGRFPLHVLNNVVYFGYKGASPQLLGACAKRNIGFSFFSGHGRFRARIAGESQGNVLLRKTQYRVSDDDESACGIARNFIVGKIYNARWVLERLLRDHPLQVDVEAVSAASSDLANFTMAASESDNLDTLRGIEGSAARSYFGVFDQMVLSNKEFFAFDGRSRRPPKDPVNALLSFAYVMLINDCASALEGAGLDSYVGFMHQDRPGRKSLALDLVEELRSVFADRVVLNCINNRKIQPKHFEERETGECLLTEEGRKVFIDAWQSKKREELRHPYLKEKVQWGLLPHVQSLLLARCLRGDIDEYPPFLWK